jgi:O-antigen/teichoic acid export membrane protein
MSKNLASGIGLVSAANMLGGILNLVMVVALTRLLPKSEFATIALMYMIFTIFSTVGTLGLPSALLFMSLNSQRIPLDTLGFGWVDF